MDFMLTYHVEGEAEVPSREVYGELERQVRLADELGYTAAWFAEHHFHVHRGHLPNPLLFALHLAGRTERTSLGSAVLCANLYHPLRLAEDLATAEVLTGGRLSIGLGSGSTPPEFAAFGVPAEGQAAEARHARFAEQLEVLEQAWRGGAVVVEGAYVRVQSPPILPRPVRPLPDFLWIAANSEPQAVLTGKRGYGMMLSRERTAEETARLVRAYQTGTREARWPGQPAGGARVAASRALYVGETDVAAAREAEAAVAIMVERQRRTRPQFAHLPPPEGFEDAAARVQFVAGGPETVACRLRELRRAVPFTAFHLQPRWQGLAPEQVEASIARFWRHVAPELRETEVAHAG